MTNQRKRSDTGPQCTAGCCLSASSSNSIYQYRTQVKISSVKEVNRHSTGCCLSADAVYPPLLLPQVIYIAPSKTRRTASARVFTSKGFWTTPMIPASLNSCKSSVSG